MYIFVNPFLREMSPILLEDEVQNILGVEAIQFKSENMDFLNEIQGQLRTLDYKEVDIN